MSSPTDLLPVAETAMDLASKMMRERLIGAVTYKTDRDFATSADFAIERAVRQLLADTTPTIGFLGEEEGRSGSIGPAWTLDPIDGTVNYTRDIPLCGISLALVDGDISQLGVIDLPQLNERYTAVKGASAYLNRAPIRVRNESRLDHAIVSIGDYATGDDSAAKNTTRLAVTSRLAQSTLRVRMFGSAAVDLAWLAAGRIDAVVILANHPWDTAAGVAIAREAGAAVIDLDGKPHDTTSTYTIATTPALRDNILSLVRQALGQAAVP